MSVWIVFSNNEKIGSRVISYGTTKKPTIDNVPSHFSYCFKETYVLESRLTSGVHADEWENFKSKNKIIAIFDVTENVEEIYGKWYKYYQYVYKKIMGKAYDWPAVYYLGWRYFLWKFLSRKLPIINKKNDENKYFCVEIFEDIFRDSLEMYSPNRLMARCQKSLKRVL